MTRFDRVRPIAGVSWNFVSYTVAQHKLVVFVESDWREQPKRRPLSPGLMHQIAETPYFIA